MAPNSQIADESPHCNGSKKLEYRRKIVWRNVIFFTYLHLSTLYGFYLVCTSASLKTFVFVYIFGNLGGLGITAGAHRLWTHRSYKAKWPLRIFLCIMNCVSGQGNIYDWSIDHRVHHKFTETDADPHNIKRGFFFAHVGWLMCERHPDNIEKEKTVKVDDLWADPIVRFQKRFYIPLLIFFSFYLPTMIPVWCWGESVWNSFFVATVVRYCISLNFTWLVNSAAHKFGDQSFDKYIEARENRLVSFLAIGEGWHNYHHVFPWDYSTSELGYTFNLTKVFIDLMAMIGLAYDLKTAGPDVIKNKKLKSGDGTRRYLNDNPGHNLTEDCATTSSDK